MAISIGIVEDHSEFRQSLEYLILSDAGFRLVWSYASVEEALDDSRETDIILFDFHLPGLWGIQALPLFKQKHPLPKIIMFTILEDDHLIFEAIKNGADGYIPKKTGPAKILDTLLMTYRGEAELSPMIARQVVDYLETGATKAALPSKLIAIEKQILTLITRGMNDEQIAGELSINNKAVRSHIKSIYDKIHLHARSQAIIQALKEKPVKDKPT